MNAANNAKLATMTVVQIPPNMVATGPVVVNKPLSKSAAAKAAKALEAHLLTANGVASLAAPAATPDVVSTAPSAARLETLAAGRNWAAAVKGETGALLALYMAVAAGGLTTPEDVTSWNPQLVGAVAGVYSSRFNKAAKCAGFIGIKPTRALITEAATLPGKVWENVEAALDNVRAAGKAAGGTTATAVQVATFMRDAVKVAGDKAAAKVADRVKVKADKKAEAKPATGPGPVIIQAAALQVECRQDVAALQVQIQRIMAYPVAANRKGLQSKAVHLLGEVVELLTQLSK